MQKHGFMVTRALVGFLLLTSLASTLRAQPSQDSITLNNIKAIVNANGNLFRAEDREGFEAPANSGNGVFFNSAPWIGGYTPDNRLKVSALTYASSAFDFRPGPIADTYNAQYFEQYNRVWKITRAQINRHKARFNEPGYTTPEVIRNWPARRQPDLGIDHQPAPFTDSNGNGVYDPENGDYPAIRGDVAIFYIISDDHPSRATTSRKPLGIELRGMVYAFDRPQKPALNNAVFVNYRLANISDQDYQDVYLGQFADFDLGYAFDDYVGCDPKRDLFYSYNGDNFDEQGNYGNRPPSAGVSFLNTPLNTFAHYKNNFSDFGNPERAVHYYRYLQAIWKNGQPITKGGRGRDVDAPVTPYVFPGDPLDTSEWSMRSAELVPQDQRGIGAAGPFTLNAGEQLCLDMGFLFARVSGESDTLAYLNSLTKLKKRQDSLAAFYERQSYECPAIDTFATSYAGREKPSQRLRLYPNPGHHKLNIRLPEGAERVREAQIFGSDGQLIKRIGAESRTVQVGGLEPGFYMVRVQTADQTYIRKWLKQ